MFLLLLAVNIVARVVNRNAFAVRIRIRISRVRAIYIIRKAGFTARTMAAFRMFLSIVIGVVTVAVAAILTVCFSLLLLLLYLTTKMSEVVFDRF